MLWNLNMSKEKNNEQINGITRLKKYGYFHTFFITSTKDFKLLFIPTLPFVTSTHKLNCLHLQIKLNIHKHNCKDTIWPVHIVHIHEKVEFHITKFLHNKAHIL